MSAPKNILGLLCGVVALAGCGSSAHPGDGSSTGAAVAAASATPAERARELDLI